MAAQVAPPAVGQGTAGQPAAHVAQDAKKAADLLVGEAKKATAPTNLHITEPKKKATDIFSAVGAVEKKSAEKAVMNLFGGGGDKPAKGAADKAGAKSAAAAGANALAQSCK